ncbi:hypothetical protein [Candidatus Arsenophonus triatominarum]|uniref:hypothetical protein n=1 Tax=Candidatus Arsenophonus triatominarum TaxID=57911 RepID=UPI001FDEE57B|nr:hypothetical protein [Candidatus Arsenophonus triatominarum]
MTTPAAVAQDVASACLVFMGECYFDRSLGIPWKEEVLGRRPTAGFIAQKLQVEAEKLPVVNQAIASVRLDKASRKLRGVIRVTDNENNRLEVIL